MNIVVIHEPDSESAKTWSGWLREAGHNVFNIYDDDSWQKIIKTNIDAVVPVITIKDYLDKTNARYNAARYYEDKGVPLLNITESIAVSSDKLKTAQLFEKHRIKHPKTSILDEHYEWTNGTERKIVKPRFGHSGRNVHLVDSEDEAADLLNDSNEKLLVQEYIEDPDCIRVVCTSDKILSSYKKVLPGKVVVNVELGAKREKTELSPHAKKAATEAVKAFKGGVMGIDLLINGESVYVLEGNVPFGIDLSDNVLKDRLVKQVERLATVG